MKQYLKVKVKSLAAEAIIIRKEEILAKRQARSATERGKSQASHHYYQVFFGLKSHRRNEVRSEARSAQLAYGFLRGRSYAQMERLSFILPDFDRIKKLVYRYGDKDSHDRFEAWKNEALIHFQMNDKTLSQIAA